MSLFGHHHVADPSFGSRVADIAGGVAHLPLAVWLTVLPIAGGLAIAYVTHRLNLTRDRLTLRREQERQRADDERVASRVYTDLAFRLARHRNALRSATGGDFARLAAAHDALVLRAAETDVIDVLGKRYRPFMAVLQREETMLARLASASDGRRLATEVDYAAELAELEASLDTYLELFER